MTCKVTRPKSHMRPSQKQKNAVRRGLASRGTFYSLPLNKLTNVYAEHKSHKPRVNLTTFHLFLKLPVELQLAIWKEVSQFPRIVEFALPSRKNDKAPCRTPSPALLHVCALSRAEGLKTYSKLPGYGLSKSWSAYVNWDIDAIYLSGQGRHTEKLLNHMTSNYKPTKSIGEKYQHVIVHEDCIAACAHRPFKLGFEGLMKLTIISSSLFKTKEESKEQTLALNTYRVLLLGQGLGMSLSNLRLFQQNNRRLDVEYGTLKGSGDFRLKESKWNIVSWALVSETLLTTVHRTVQSSV
jgi:hypothetical protein